ncbi:MAG: T9SS type B sorting domain-containing protein [Bacteroidetes bacterium]|nr:MAG: T9SS type B sorting domain-containing protein [Bacteroidota bacterium]
MKNSWFIIIFGILVGYNSFSQTTTVTQNADFESENNSMWGLSGSPSIEDEISLFHVDWNQSINTGSSGIVTILGQSFGGAFQGGISGQIGSKIRYNFTTGSIDVKYPVDIDITYPQDFSYDQGDMVTVQTDYTVLDSNALETIYPGGEVMWDLYFQLAASASATICVFGCTTFPIIPSFNTGLITVNLVTISSNGATTGPGGTSGPSGIWYLGPGQTPPYIGGSNEDPSYPGTEPTVNNSFFPFAVPPADVDTTTGELGTIFIDWIPWQIYVPLQLDLPENEFGLSGTLTLPYVETESNLLLDNTLEACGDSTYFTMALEVFDLLGYILQQAAPGTPVYVAGQVLSNLAGAYDPLADTPFAGLAVVQWNFFSASLVLDITNNQCFNFDPTISGSFQFPFPVEYQVFSNGAWGPQLQGSIINCQIGDDFRYKFPCYFTDVTFIPTYTIVGTMSNHTWDEIAVHFDMSALGFGLQLSAFTILPGFTIPSVCFPLPYPCPSWSCPWCWCTTTVCTPEIVVPPVGFPGFAAWVSTSGINFGSSIPDPLPTLWSYTVPIASITYDWFNSSWTLNNFNTVIGDTIRMKSSPLGISNSFTNVLCSDSTTGQLIVNTSALTPASPFTYSLWSDAGTSTSVVAGNTNTYSNLAAGSYQVSVIDANGCQMYTGAIITEPLPVQAISAISDKNCFGTVNDGSILVTASGGVPGYNVSWSGTSSGSPAGIEISNVGGTYTISGLSEGTYNVTITDANNCPRMYSYTVGVPDALGQVGIVTDVNCFGESTGAIDVSTFGGVLPYSYSWTSLPDFTEDVDSIPAGNYTLTVTDSRNCISSVIYTVNQPAAPLALSITGTDVNCFGGSDGTINLTTSGGTSGYSYVWSNGQGVILPMTTEDLSNIPASVYTVDVTDSKGCTESISQSIAQPSAPVSSNPTITNINCFGDATGSINPGISGGTAPYTYNWSTGFTGAILTGVAAGSYTLNVTDSRGCTSSYSYQITQPGGPLTVTLSGVDILCFGEATGSVTSVVSGGTPGYQYSWIGGMTTASISNLTAGTYDLTVTDSRGCVASASITLNQPAAALTASSIATDVNCYGGSDGTIDLTVNGGTTPYNYQWSNAQSLILTATTQDLNGLPANVYTVNITDDNGCETTVSQPVAQPNAPLAVTGVVDDVNCFGITDGSIDISVSGGTIPYTYSWSNGAVTEDLTNIAAGSYTVQITDLNGCTITETFEVAQPNAALAVSATTTPVKCNGGSDGTVTSFVEGGTSPYTYSWSTGATTPDLEFMPAGIYTLTVTDSQGCVAFTGAVVDEPANPLNVVITVTDPSCYGYSNGSIVLDITGGTQPYYFNWGNENEILLNNPSETLSDITVGDYLFRIRDANGCIIEQIVTVNEPTLLTVSHVISDALCYGDSTGMIDLTVTGATPPYTFVWSDGQSTEDAVNLPAGYYTYTVTDAQGCEFWNDAIVGQPTELKIEYIITPISCIDQTDGMIDVTAYDGTAPYTYVWSTGETTPSISGLAAGTYMLVVTDDHLCSQTYDFVVDSNPDECVGIPNTFTPNGDDYNDTWFLENIDLYPNASVKIFNKWGNLLYNTEGNYIPWDGTFNGNPLPSEVYYYIITLGNPEDNQYTGTITIVR